MSTHAFEDVTCVGETDRALHVQAPDLDPLRCKRWPDYDRCWIPKAAVHGDSEVYGMAADRNAGKLVLHAWFVDSERGEENRPAGFSKRPPRGREVPTPEVLKVRPLKPPGR